MPAIAMSGATAFIRTSLSTHRTDAVVSREGLKPADGGFRRFVNGETDISNASRVMSESERQTAAANRVEFIELRVALDGLSVMVNPRNDFVECLTVEDLRRNREPGFAVNTWQQVRDSFPEYRATAYTPGLTVFNRCP
jgi:phosphate transport system substrate-binding protein